MDFIKNIFDYLEGKMSEAKKADFFNHLKDSKEDREKFNTVLNFKVERSIYRAHLSKRELNVQRRNVYHKIQADDAFKESDNKLVIKLSAISFLLVLCVALSIFVVNYIQQYRQAETVEYLATVEIQDESNDISLILSTGEKITLNETVTKLDKSDVKIVADKNSVNVSSVVPKESCSKRAASSNVASALSKERPVKERLNYLRVKGKEDFLLSLEDGSKIWMRHNSKVGFPDKFSKKERSILFEGEGYFSIASDSLRPFIIKTKGVEAKVLGTEFNLQSERDASTIKINMISGKLAVKNEGKEDVILTKDHQFVLDTETDVHTICKSDNFKYKAWKDGYFLFVDDNLKDIVEILSYMYEMEITVQTDKYDKELFNGKMKRSNGLDKIILALEESYDFKFYMEDGVLYIY